MRSRSSFLLLAGTWVGAVSPALAKVNAGYNVTAVVNEAIKLAGHSWEYGTASEALLELYNPERSVFGKNPFPKGKIPKVCINETRSLEYAKQWIETNGTEFIDGDGAVGDPASLGVSALLIGHASNEYSAYLTASDAQAHSILYTAPRYWNDAISQRYSVAELWADFVYMAPPFLAYYAVSTNNASLLNETVRQCGLYRQILQSNTTAAYHGLWEHIVGPDQAADSGLWSTGNGWAAMGMARVLATLSKWKVTAGYTEQIAAITSYIKEILDGAIAVSTVVGTDSGLLRNYLNNSTWFGDASGTSLLAATAYRMAVLDPATFNTTHYIDWAEERRVAVAKHVNDTTGIISPSVDPLGWHNSTPYTAGSPEGESFGVMLWASYRDWVRAGKAAS